MLIITINLFKNMILSLYRTLIILFLFFNFISDIYSQDDVDPNGYNTFYYTDGNISSEGNLKDGKPDGFWKKKSRSGMNP